MNRSVVVVGVRTLFGGWLTKGEPRGLRTYFRQRATNPGRPMATDDESPTHAVLETLIERAETTIEFQIETVSDLEDRAIRIYRGIVILTSVLVGGLSIVAESGGSIWRVVSINLVVGVVLLVVGFPVAIASTFRSSGLRAGITPDHVDVARAGNRDESLSTVLDEYAAQLEDNDDVLRTKAQLFTYTVLLGFDGLVFVSAGVLTALLVDSGPMLAYAVALTACALPLGVFASKVLAFPDLSGGRYLVGTVAVLVVPTVATVLAGRVAPETTVFVWTLVPLLLATLSLLERSTARFGFVGYFRALLALAVGSSLVPLLAPGRVQAVVRAVGSVEFSAFVLVSTGLLTVDYWMYHQ